MKNKRIILLIVLIIITVSFIIYYSNNKVYIDSNNYDNYSNDSIAVFVEQSDGKYEFSNTFPTKDSGYIINSSKTVCNNGSKIKWNNDSWSAMVSNLNKKNTKCYIYFDKVASPGINIVSYINGVESNQFPSKTSDYIVQNVTCTNGVKASFDYENWTVNVDAVKDTTCVVNFTNKINETFANYLANKKCAITPTTDNEAKDCLVDENGLRFEGSDPNNYVLFNNELWRVIGTFKVKNSVGTEQQLVKLIREKTLIEVGMDGNNKNNWAAQSLNEQLNNNYFNSTDVQCITGWNYVERTCHYSKSGLNITARVMVESVVWNLGGHSGSTEEQYSHVLLTAQEMYETEIGTARVSEENPTSWTGKIALMYASDYGYAVLENHCSRTITLYDYRDNNSCVGNNWLYQDGYQWFLNPNADFSNVALSMHNGGYIYSNDAVEGYGIRPTLYLKSTVKVIGGSGTRNWPYIIE